MQKEKLMQFLSKAIDNGARITITLHGDGVKKEVAERTTMQFGELVDAPVTVEQGDNFKWFCVDDKNFRLSHFHEESNHTNFLEEDVDLSGSAEIA